MDYTLAALDLPELHASQLLDAGDACLVSTLAQGRASPLSVSNCSFLLTYVGNATLVLHRLLQAPSANQNPHRRALYLEYPTAAETLSALVVHVARGLDVAEDG